MKVPIAQESNVNRTHVLQDHVQVCVRIERFFLIPYSNSVKVLVLTITFDKDIKHF